MKFGITKDFDSAKCEIGDTGNVLEVKKLDGNEYVVILHTKDSPYELGIYTKKELETLWRMLSNKE